MAEKKAAARPAAAKVASKQKAAVATDPQAEIKQRLGRRMAFAGVMIAVLLAALALFDHLSKPHEEEEVTAVEPAPAPKEVAQPVTPVESLPPPPAPAEKAAEAPAEPELSAAPADKGKPAPDLPPPPQVAAQPAAAPRAAASRATPFVPQPAASGAVRAAVPAPRGVATAPSAAAPAVAPSPVTHGAVTPPAHVPAQAPAQAPASVQPLPIGPRPQPAPPRLFSGFVVQAGVFSSTERAEELHAKLQLNGIASSIESRVNVGPFKSREEAEAARAKLKSLGLESVLVPPPGVRR